MASASLTITSVTGPGIVVTEEVINNVSKIDFDLARSVLSVTYTESNGGNSKIQEFDYNDAVTLTYTIDGRLATIVIGS